jgi:hypothetical protein
MLDFLSLVLDLSGFLADRIEFWVNFLYPLVQPISKETNKKESTQGSENS